MYLICFKDIDDYVCVGTLSLFRKFSWSQLIFNELVCNLSAFIILFYSIFVGYMLFLIHELEKEYFFIFLMSFFVLCSFILNLCCLYSVENWKYRT